MDNHIEITPILMHEKYLRTKIKCDECWMTDYMFDNLVKKIALPPHSEYTILILLLQHFIKAVEDNREAAHDATQINYLFSYEMNCLKKTHTVSVKAVVGEQNQRILIFFSDEKLDE